MSDIATTWDGVRGDYVLDGADLRSGDDLATAVFISVFTDATALEDDAIPDGTTNPRGWWAGPIGSRLWLLQRAKRTQETLARAHDYVTESLQWLIADGVCSKIDVACEWVDPSELLILVTLYRFDGTVRDLRFEWAWAPTSRPLATAAGEPRMFDPYFDNVLALLLGDGPNGSPTFTDSSRHARTFFRAWGNVAISTANPKYGTGALSGDATANALQSSFDAGGAEYDDWTLDFWVRRKGNNDTGFLLCNNTNLVVACDAGLAHRVFLSADTYRQVIATSSLPVGEYAHVALVISKEGSSLVCRLFFNGMLESTYSQAYATPLHSRLKTASTTFMIGIHDPAYFSAWNMDLDCWRLTAGVARWTSNFTPPASLDEYLPSA